MINGRLDSTSENPAPVVLTVGHSNHTLEDFIELLKSAGVNAIADVRSVPYSRYTSQFNREALSEALKAEGIAYSFLGGQLGARPENPDCFRQGTADYDLIAASSFFKEGLERVIVGAEKYKIALMCAEKEPLDCHRTILVGHALKHLGVLVRHIHASGQIEECGSAEKRLVKMTKQEMSDLFQAPEIGDDPVERAYKVRGREIAYTESHGSKEPISNAR
jgi:uncharacterized protein (DUF488 family)